MDDRVVRRYSPGELDAANGEKPVKAGPWVGRAWIEYDEEVGAWLVTREPDGEAAVTEEHTSQEAAIAAALADERVRRIYPWSAESKDYLPKSRADMR